MAHCCCWNSRTWYLQGFPSAVVWPIAASYSGKLISFSWDLAFFFFFLKKCPKRSAVLFTFLFFSILFLLCTCSSALWCFFLGTCFLGTCSPPPLDLLPHHLLPLTVPALLIVYCLYSAFLHALEKNVRWCNVRQLLMKKQGMDLTPPHTCKSLTRGILLAFAGTGCSRWQGCRD